MSSQFEGEDEEDYYDDEDDINYYYCNEEELRDEFMEDSAEKSRKNIEFFDYECISIEQAKLFVNSQIDNLSKTTNVGAI